MQLLALPNLNTIKDDYPGFFEDMQKLVVFTNSHVVQVGGYSNLTFAGSIGVVGAGGVIDVKITDNNARAGEEYFVEYDTVPSFTSAHVVAMGPGRNRRFGDLPGITTFWRCYKSTKLGGTSNIITFGSPPVGVNPGGAAGPPPSGGSGSGTSGGSGAGYGCVLKGTKITALGFDAQLLEVPNSEWIVLKLLNGRTLTATPDHPVMTESGKCTLEALSIGSPVITLEGLSEVVSLKRLRHKGIKIKASMKRGHLFWANGILSHNLKKIL